MRIVPLRGFDAAVPQQHCDAFDRYTFGQHSCCERMPKQMRMHSPRLLISFLEVSQFKEGAQGTLPICHGRLGVAVSAPKEVFRVRLGPRRYSTQHLGYELRDGAENRI